MKFIDKETGKSFSNYEELAQYIFEEGKYRDVTIYDEIDDENNVLVLDTFGMFINRFYNGYNSIREELLFHLVPLQKGETA